MRYRILLLILLALCLLLPAATAAETATITCQIDLDLTTVAAGSPISARWAVLGASPDASISCFWTLSQYGSPETWYDADPTTQPATFTPSYGSSGSFVVVVEEPTGQAERFDAHFWVTQGGSTLFITVSLDKGTVAAGSPITANWEAMGGVPPYTFDCGWETDEANAGFSVQPFRATRRESTDSASTAWPEIGDIGRFWVTVTDRNGRSEYADISFEITGGRLLSRRVAEIVAQCRAAASGEYARAKWLFDYLDRIPDAGGTTMESSSPHCVLLLGNGLCESYATAYDLLCGLVGVESRFIGGRTIDDEGHAWVLVRLGGSWYHADPMWGSAFFLMSDDEAARSRVWDRGRYPACPLPYGQSLRGDANQDGLVDVADLSYLMDFLTSSMQPPFLGGADTTGDGLVDLRDLLDIIAIILPE